MTSPYHRDNLRVPSEWDVAVAHELAPLFVLEAAILVARRSLDANLPQPRDRAAAIRLQHMRLDMARLRTSIAEYRAAEELFADDCAHCLDEDDDVSIPDEIPVSDGTDPF